jgi:hypothetical protein
MKTRIKIITLKDGAVEFHPQVKRSLFWMCPDEYGSWYNTLEAAQNYLDSYIGNKKETVSYLKYP